MESKSVKDIKAYHKNPRKITGKMFDTLSQSLKDYGDLSGIVVNVNTGEAVGGNQRTAFFKQEPLAVSIEILERLDKPTPQGTVAYGYVFYNGERYNYREVNWDEKKTDRANILANKVGGFWDNDILANQFDVEDLLLAGFEDFELGFDSGVNVVADEWEGMPLVNEEEVEDSFQRIIVHFADAEAVREFSHLVKQKLTDKTKSIHFPYKEKEAIKDLIVKSE